MKFNRTSFFSCFRAYHKAERNKSLVQSQVDGLTFLLDAIEQDPAWKLVTQVSYFIATIAHETAWTFKPIKEYRGKTLSPQQKKYWPSGYYGRGYIQLTWEQNYEKAGEHLGVNLVDNPDSALVPEVAYMIAAAGMREGWFTGHRLGTHIGNVNVDYKNARRIVNGLDKASHIAGIAQNIEKCLRSSVADDVDKGKSGASVGIKGGESGETQPPTDTEATATSVTSKTTVTKTDTGAETVRTTTEENPTLLTRLKTSTTFAQSVGINVGAVVTGIIAFFQNNYKVMLGTAAVVVAVFLIYNWRESKRGK